MTAMAWATIILGLGLVAMVLAIVLMALRAGGLV